MNAAAEMPRYKCHKEVHALKISQFRATMSSGMTLYFEDEGFEPIEIPESEVNPFLELKDSNKGYLVVYADGYRSWSPTKAFEEGYTRL